MGRYLVIWSVDATKVPTDPKSRAQAWSAFVDMVRQAMKEGRTKDWGSFVGELNGYSIIEGTEVEVALELQKYVPFIDFEVKPIGTLDQVAEVLKAMAK